MWTSPGKTCFTIRVNVVVLQLFATNIGAPIETTNYLGDNSRMCPYFSLKLSNYFTFPDMTNEQMDELQAEIGWARLTTCEEERRLLKAVKGKDADWWLICHIARLVCYITMGGNTNHPGSPFLSIFVHRNNCEWVLKQRMYCFFLNTDYNIIIYWL